MRPRHAAETLFGCEKMRLWISEERVVRCGGGGGVGRTEMGCWLLCWGRRG